MLTARNTYLPSLLFSNLFQNFCRKNKVRLWTSPFLQPHFKFGCKTNSKHSYTVVQTMRKYLQPIWVFSEKDIRQFTVRLSTIPTILTWKLSDVHVIPVTELKV